MMGDVLRSFFAHAWCWSLSEVRVRWQVLTLRGHSAAIRSVAFSLNGKLIVSGSDDKFVKVWDVATGAEVSSMEGRECVQGGG